MKQLISNIKIIFDSSVDVLEENRIFVNSGTILASQQCEGYYKNSFAPKETWRQVTDQEMQLLLNSQRLLEIGLWIRILKIPDELVYAFASLSKAKNSRRLSSLVSTEQIVLAKERLETYLRTITNYGISPIGIGMNKPGLPTVTREKMLIGLHIDSCYREPVNVRLNSNNRFMLNLGQETRSFLFINLSVDRLLEELQALGYDRDWLVTRGVTNIARLFLKTFPQYPVIKIKVFPGEAYIAPTENIIHDASTLDMSQNDLYLTTRSRFVC